MTAQLPTRITIELHPGEGAQWTARTAVDDVEPRIGPTVLQTHAPEPRESLLLPAAYQPGACTCLEAGGCDVDHAND